MIFSFPEISGSKDPASKLKNFFSTKVSKCLYHTHTHIYTHPHPPSFSPLPPHVAFNATTTSSKKAEYLLWLAKAKKINKITLIQFQNAKVLLLFLPPSPSHQTFLLPLLSPHHPLQPTRKNCSQTISQTLKS